MRKLIEASAPGKVHLIGEHSVVYGEPAIISAVGMRINVAGKENDYVHIDDKRFGKRRYALEDVMSFTKQLDDLWEDGFDRGDFRALNEALEEDTMNHTKGIIGKSLESLGVESGVSLEIESQIPLGAGLGSSAALSVVIPKTISEVYGEPITEDSLNEIAYETEKFAHGTPSGGDNSTCCYGGMMWFRKGKPNVIESLREEVPYQLKNFVLVYTKEPEKDTRGMVDIVRELDPSYRNPRVRDLGKAACQMREALKKKDFGSVGALMNSAQEKLSELGGAAKLSGAGGGGIMICYHPDGDKLVGKVNDLGYEPWKTDLGVEGVRIED